MPSNPVWRCPSTPDLGHEPCEAETSRQSSLPYYGVLSLSPCFWAPPSAWDLRPLCSAPSQPFQSLPCTPLLLGEEEKRKQRSSPWVPGPRLGSDLRPLPSRLQDHSQPWPPAECLIWGCAQAPARGDRPPCQGPHSCPLRGQPPLLPRGPGLPVSGTAVRSLRTP